MTDIEYTTYTTSSSNEEDLRFLNKLIWISRGSGAGTILGQAKTESAKVGNAK